MGFYLHEAPEHNKYGWHDTGRSPGNGNTCATILYYHSIYFAFNFMRARARAGAQKTLSYLKAV
jgi:hypothetical protein